jgi:uncharacterized protein (DUF1501 family)
MATTRRTFLTNVGAAGIVSLGATPPWFLTRAALATEKAEKPPTEKRILVLVQLAGGNDGLNTVIPYTDPEYQKARPGIGIGKDAVLKIGDDLGLHPQMTGFREIFDEGRLAVIQGVGYPNPNRSHFRSTDIWHSARPDVEYTEDGWLGRSLDLHAKRHAGKTPALALGTDRLPLALVCSKLSVPTVQNVREFQLQLGAGSVANRKLRRRLIGDLANRPSATGSDLDFLRKTTQTALTTARKLEKVTATYKPAAEYPGNGLGQKLKTVAQLIAGDFGTNIFFVSLGGFDTHSQQAGAHQGLLTELSSAIRAFYLDLKEHKLQDRVLLATYSEFGRRVKENGSLGTDHGAASQMFVVTPGDKGGLIGKHPSLTDLSQGDLKHHTDFRSVYATILDNWLDISSQSVLGHKFPAVDFV